MIDITESLIHFIIYSIHYSTWKIIEKRIVLSNLLQMFFFDLWALDVSNVQNTQNEQILFPFFHIDKLDHKHPIN